MFCRSSTPCTNDLSKYRSRVRSPAPISTNCCRSFGCSTAFGKLSLFQEFSTDRHVTETNLEHSCTPLVSLPGTSSGHVLIDLRRSEPTPFSSLSFSAVAVKLFLGQDLEERAHVITSVEGSSQVKPMSEQVMNRIGNNWLPISSATRKNTYFCLFSHFFHLFS